MTDQQQIELPSWLVPESSASLPQLKQQNLFTLYEGALPGLLNRMIETGSTFRTVVQDDPRNFDYAHLFAWVMKDENRKQAYYEAQVVTAEIISDDLIRIADASDSIEDVQRSTLKINTRKWLLGVWNRKRFGETRQQETTINVNIGDAMAEAQARVDARRTVDVDVRRVE